jgi:cell division transport system permease protein
VLKKYIKDNASNAELIVGCSQTDNPLPATIQIKPRDLNKLGDIKTYLEKQKLPRCNPTSPRTPVTAKKPSNKITHATNIMQRAGVVAVFVFAVISVLIIFNTIQMAIFNRRDELTIMRLLGAAPGTSADRSWWKVLFTASSLRLSPWGSSMHCFVAAHGTLEATSLGLLDINFSAEYFRMHFWELLLLQVGVGILIGAVSSVVATQRYLKFKTKK